MYAAFAQAYTPALVPLDVSVASVGSEPHHSKSHEYKPTCGVSLAVVAKASLLDQQDQYAGTAHLTNEILWCPMNDVDGNNRTLRTSCLPNSNVQEVPDAQPLPTPPPPPAPEPEPAPAPAQPVIQWAAPAAPSLHMASGAGAWQAKLMASATKQLRQQWRREPARMPNIGDADPDNICNNPGVGFANPGAFKVTLDLLANKQLG